MSTRVLFVCMGNVCRSPMADSVFRQMVRVAGLDDVVRVASAGTHGFHEGEACDPRARAALHKRGYDGTEIRARKVTERDLEEFDLILAMDWDNLSLLQQSAPKRLHHKLQLLMRFASEHETATVPDPYHGSEQNFEEVLDYIEDACSGLLEVAKRRATQVAAA